ncbi:pneumococcal-type histidine triad protein [Streptococcus respiraculi]|uniref:pneumococcal-type histidine triad protein n=1 Tax=Streptococcus respiraculi TaxID=2021971 RepID=UPI000E768237|nr:pneumococcal-type histidine triad protein [Streptococcus respiraculi]
MKKKYIIGSVAMIALSLCSYELGRQQGGTKTESHRVAYVDKTDTSTENNPTRVEELTPEQVSAKENIAAEQIVIKITDQGYVTSHGDHYHYYNGKVPFDAIISEDLIMKDPVYQLQDSDIVNEVKDGYIIKVNGQYYLYLKNKENPVNVRSKDAIDQQRRQHIQAQAKANRPVTGAVAVAKQQGRYTTDDGYIFNPNDIIEDTGDAYIVPHGNHFHYIPKSALSPDELRAAQAFWNSRNQATVASPKTTTTPQVPIHIGQVPPALVQQPVQQGRPAPNHPAQPNRPGTPVQPIQTGQVVQPVEEEIIRLLKELYALPLSQRYMEEDGLVFDPVQITNRTDRGVVVPHGDHYHFIPYDRLSALEQKIAKMIPIGRSFPGLKDPKGVGIVSQPQKPQPAKPKQPAKPAKPHQPAKPKQPTKPAKPNQPTQPSKPSQPSHSTKPEKPVSTQPSKPTQPAGTEKPHKKTMYSQEEVDAAKAAGRYVSVEDGYIFKAEDIISDEGDSYIIFRDNYTHWVDKESLSEKELTEAKAFCQKKGLKAPAADDISYFDASKEKAEAVFERVAAKKIIPFERLPYNVGYASEVKKGKIIIPHRDHYHNLDVAWFNDSDFFKAPSGYSLEDLFATIKYYLAHPEERPYSQYGWGTLDEGKQESPTTSSNKPTETPRHPDRDGKPNSQIVYTAEEIAAAKAAGRYTTSDGYIFDARDIVEDLGDGYLVPHMSHSHYIPKKYLSKKEQEEARNYVAKAGLKDKKEEKPSTPEKESALDIYNRVTPEKIVPVEAMPYNSAYVVDFQNGQMIIPHYDHYHNIALSWFDEDHYHAPQGYTLEQFLATVKYYVLHPEDRPISEDGFGSSSNYGKEDVVDKEEEEPVDEPDEDELAQRKLASEFGMSVDDFQDKLVKIALKYKVAMDSFNYQPEQKTVSLVTKDGKSVLVSLETLEEIPTKE